MLRDVPVIERQPHWRQAIKSQRPPREFEAAFWFQERKAIANLTRGTSNERWLMKNKPNSPGSERPPAASPGPARKSVLILTTLLGSGAVALLLVASKHRRPADQAPVTNAVEEQPAPEAPRPAKRATEDTPPPVEPMALAAESPEVDRDAIARQLIKDLSEVNLQPGELNREKAEKWHREFEQLIEQGTAAVPPLREFFQSHADVKFDSAAGTNLLGEPTLRIAFMKVLFDVPAPDNIDLQEEVLRTTTDPGEVVLLARQLEQQEPGKYRDIIVSTARESLAQIKSGRWPSQNAVPLVNILKQYEDEHAK